MKRWRRPLILIALLLLAGAVVNVAVAWAAALWGSVGEAGSIASAPRWAFAAPPCPGDEVVDSWVSLRLGTTRAESESRLIKFTPLPAKDYLYHTASGSRTFACGWPMLCLRACEQRVWDSPGGPRPVESPAPGLTVPAGGSARDLRLPLDPLVRGFAINTLFYTAILALPLSVFPIRRRLRARRGRCPKCGYDLAGLAGAEPGAEGAAPCPECGATR